MENTETRRKRALFRSHGGLAFSTVEILSGEKEFAEFAKNHDDVSIVYTPEHDAVPLYMVGTDSVDTVLAFFCANGWDVVDAGKGNV